MRVAFRVDASERIGTGHMIRCLALCEVLQARGAEVHIISADIPGNMGTVVEARGFRLLEINANDGSEESDAQQTAKLVAAQDFEWLVVDHYSLGRPWEEALSLHVGRILVIDDLCRSHHCDMLVDQNCVVDRSVLFRGQLAAGCEILLGPEYALLGSEVAHYARRQSDCVRRVMVYFGGSDPGNLTGLAVEALTAPGLEDLELDIVVGLNSSHGAAVRALASMRGRAQVHGFQRSLAPLMASSDLAVGAGGVTALERLAVGLPSLVVSIADNQTAGCEALAGIGLIEYLGRVESITATLVSETAMNLRSDIRRLRIMSEGGRRLVDGKGAERVAGRMLA